MITIFKLWPLFCYKSFELARHRFGITQSLSKPGKPTDPVSFYIHLMM